MLPQVSQDVLPTAGEGQKHLFEHQDPHFFSIPNLLQTVLVYNPCIAAVVRDVASVPRNCPHIPDNRDTGQSRADAEEGRDNVSKLLVASGWSLTPSPAAFQFFILVSLVFLTQLIGAVLFLVHWKQVLAPSPVSPASLCHTVAMAQSLPGNWGWCRDTLPPHLRRQYHHTNLKAGGGDPLGAQFPSEGAGAVQNGRGTAPVLAPIPQVQPEQFLSELQRNYGGDEGAEIFSTAWNTLMVTVSSWEATGGHTGSTKGGHANGVSFLFQFSCCGVLGPEDFGNGSRFQELNPGMPWPRACCARDGLLQAGEVLGWEQCQDRSPGYIHEQVQHNSAVSVSLSKPWSVPGSWSRA